MQAIKIHPRREPNSFMASIGEISIWQLFGVSIVFFTTFWNLVSLDRDKEVIGLDGQVYLKLLFVGGAGLYGALGFLTDKRIRDVAFSFPSVWVLVLFTLFALASVLSASPATAMASSLSILCIYLMTVTAAMELGKELLAKTIFFGLGAFVVGSWLAYFLVPSIGIMEEPIEGGEFAVRMSGLAHSNTLGQHSAMCMIFGIGLWTGFRHRGWLIPILVVLSLLALIGSLSRSSMVAAFAAVIVGFRQNILGQYWQWRVVQLGVVGLLGLLILSSQVNLGDVLERQMGVVSKSGDSDEITTATGRIDIWQKSILLIKLRPVLGYGPTTSKYLLEEYSMYTHNLLLNIGLSCGVFGLLIGLIMCLSRIGMLFSRQSFLPDALVTFIILNGCFENVIFSNLCGSPTICWVLGLGWFQMNQDAGGVE